VLRRVPVYVTSNVNVGWRGDKNTEGNDVLTYGLSSFPKCIVAALQRHPELLNARELRELLTTSTNFYQYQGRRMSLWLWRTHCGSDIAHSWRNDMVQSNGNSCHDEFGKIFAQDRFSISRYGTKVHTIGFYGDRLHRSNCLGYCLERLFMFDI
jgi:hypothetical protein